MRILEEFENLIQGIGSNELLAKRSFYDEISRVDLTLTKFVIGDFGTGKTVAARAVVNMSKDFHQYAVHLPLRNIRTLPPKLPNVRDENVGMLISYILQPGKYKTEIYSNYEEISGIESAKNEFDYLVKITEKLKESGTKLLISLDEVDVRTTEGVFGEVLRDTAKTAQFIGDLAQYMRRIYDEMKGAYINLVIFGATDAMKTLRNRLEERFGRLDYLRFREIRIPRNMNKYEYEQLFRNICRYYNFKCNAEVLSGFFATLDVPLWVAMSNIKNAVIDLLLSSGCDDIECIRSKQLQFTIPNAEIAMRVYRSLENATWAHSIKEIYGRNIAHEVEEYLRGEIFSRLDKVGFPVEKKIHPQVVVHYIDGLNGKRVVIFVKLRGGSYSLGGTLLEGLKHIFLEAMPQSKARRDKKEMRPTLYLLRHKTTNIRSLRNALIGIGVDVIEKIIPTEALYVAVSNVAGYGTGNADALNRFIEEVLTDLKNLLAG